VAVLDPGFAQGRTAVARLLRLGSYSGCVAAQKQAKVMAFHPVHAPPRPVREPLWRHVVGDVLRRERLAQKRTLKDVSEAARISMPYLSELERGMKEASSEILAAASRALGLNLADLLARAHQALAQAEQSRTTPRQLRSNRGLSSGRPLTEADAERAVTSVAELATRYTPATGVSQGTVSLAA